MLRNLQAHVAALKNQARLQNSRWAAAFERGDTAGCENVILTAGDLFTRAAFYNLAAEEALEKSEKSALAFLTDRLAALNAGGVEVKPDGAVHFAGDSAVLIDEAGTALRLLVQGAEQDA